jgi:small GTP-binding protein
LLRTLEGHQNWVWSVAFDPTGQTLASGSSDCEVKLWNPHSGELLRTFHGHSLWVNCVTFSPSGDTLASGSADGTIKLWEPGSGRLQRTLEGHRGHVLSIAFNAAGGTLASAGEDNTVRLWDPKMGKQVRILEGHTARVEAIAFSHQEDLLASKSNDHTIRLWRYTTGEQVAEIPVPTHSKWLPSLAFHPCEPLLASTGCNSDAQTEEQCEPVCLWRLDAETLLRDIAGERTIAAPVHYTTAKIVLVGDSGVGKTGLGWRLAHGEFKNHYSTHGQQFWVLDQLRTRRSDGTECEAILWDLAGQPDYRLIHALFLDEADLALIVFDQTDIRDPLRGVEFWLKQLSSCGRAEKPGEPCPKLLIGARADRGAPTLTRKELDRFCRQHDIRCHISTSALNGDGLEELVQQMKDSIKWNEKPPTVTTVTFKRIKDYVLQLKRTGLGSR